MCADGQRQTPSPRRPTPRPCSRCSTPLAARRGTWADREEVLSSGHVSLETDDDLLDPIREGTAKGSDWATALEGLGVDEPDRGRVVP